MRRNVDIRELRNGDLVDINTVVSVVIQIGADFIKFLTFPKLEIYKMLHEEITTVSSYEINILMEAKLIEERKLNEGDEDIKNIKSELNDEARRHIVKIRNSVLMDSTIDELKNRSIKNTRDINSDLILYYYGIIEKICSNIVPSGVEEEKHLNNLVEGQILKIDGRYINVINYELYTNKLKYVDILELKACQTDLDDLSVIMDTEINLKSGYGLDMGSINLIKFLVEGIRNKVEYETLIYFNSTTLTKIKETIYLLEGKLIELKNKYCKLENGDIFVLDGVVYMTIADGLNFIKAVDISDGRVYKLKCTDVQNNAHIKEINMENPYTIINEGKLELYKKYVELMKKSNDISKFKNIIKNSKNLVSLAEFNIETINEIEKISKDDLGWN